MKLGLENRQSTESKFPLPSPHRAVFQPVNRRSRACKRSSPASWGAGKSETFCSELKDGQKLWDGLPLAFRVGVSAGDSGAMCTDPTEWLSLVAVEVLGKFQRDYSKGSVFIKEPCSISEEQNYRNHMKP